MNAIEAATLQSERLVLDPLRPEDADEMVHLLSDERLYEHTGGRSLSLAELRSRYHRLALGRSEDREQIWLNWIVRLRDDRAAVGTAQATVTGSVGDLEARIAWVVGVPWQGQGIATEAALALVYWLDQRGVRSISAAIHPRHLASQRVAGRAGLCLTDELVLGEQVWRRKAVQAFT